MKKPLSDNKHFNIAGHAHELTYSCHRKSPLFHDETACRIFLDCVRKAKIKMHFHLWAYVVMPTHIHLLVWPFEREYSVAKILQAINGTMSHRYSRLLTRINPGFRSRFLDIKSSGPQFRFWQRGGGFDRNLYNETAVHNAIQYIENNPVRSKLVVQSDKYFWSSAWRSETEEKWRPTLDRQSVPPKMEKDLWR